MSFLEVSWRTTRGSVAISSGKTRSSRRFTPRGDTGIITFILVFFLVLMAAFSFFCCERKAKVKGLDLDISFSEKPLSDRLFTDIQFKWTTKKNFEKMMQDCHVYLLFWHNYNLIFQDYHPPKIPTSQWEPDNEYTYSRRIYIPPFIDEDDPESKDRETLRVVVGIYYPGDKTGLMTKEILERKIDFYPPPPDTPQIIYKEGWYDFEVDTKTYLFRWRWTTKEARCAIDNPLRDALLVIKGGVNRMVFRDQKVIFKIDDLVLEEFIPKKDSFEKSYKIKKDMLGQEDKFHLIISTDKTFIPAQVIPGSKDRRNLGVKISFIYFR